MLRAISVGVIVGLVTVTGAVGQTEEVEVELPDEIMEIITAGEDVEFSRSRCAAAMFLLKGKIVGAGADGRTRPIPDASFSFHLDGQAAEPLAIEVGRSGKFEQMLARVGPNYLVLSQDGTFPMNQDEQFVITVAAPGCRDRILAIGMEGHKGKIRLDCPDR